MTKYIVSGYIGFDNFGDEAIAKVLTDRLKSEGAEKITLISSNPQKTALIHKVNSVPMLNFFGALKESDILISGGGSLLQDKTSLKSLIYYLGIIYLALLLRKQVIIFAQGIGPISSKIGQIMTKFALIHSKEITVRDVKSYELLKSWGINSEVVKDPILELDLPKKNISGIVGIQLRQNPTPTDEFLNSLAKEIVKNFPDKKFQILSLQDSIDLEICNKFAKILRQNNICEVEVLSKLSMQEVFDKISELEYIIAMRFHAGVVAYKSGVKTLLIDYDIKVRKLAEEYKIPIIELEQSELSKEFEELKSF